jgi:hypothetical protein
MAISGSVDLDLQQMSMLDFDYVEGEDEVKVVVGIAY